MVFGDWFLRGRIVVGDHGSAGRSVRSGGAIWLAQGVIRLAIPGHLGWSVGDRDRFCIVCGATTTVDRVCTGCQRTLATRGRGVFDLGDQQRNRFRTFQKLMAGQRWRCRRGACYGGARDSGSFKSF